MGSLSDFAENEFLDHLLGITAWTTPAAVYCALFVGDPLDTGAGGAEVTVANGYIRKACAFAPATAVTRDIDQNVIVQFNEATGAWGTVTHWALYDASAAGNMLAHGALSASKAIISGNTPSIASGQITITVSAAGCSDYLAKAMLDHIFDSTGFTQPAIHVALASAALTDASTGTTLVDLVMTAYARESKSAGTTDWDTAVGDGVTANKTLIDFGALTGTGETIEAIALCDATTLGNLLVYDNTVSQAIGTGDTVQIPIGDFDISLD